MNYDWDFSGLKPYTSAFVAGTFMTVKLTVLSSLLGTALGLPLAFPLRSRGIFSRVLLVIVDAIRALPNLVLIFFFYYFPYSQIFRIEAPSPYASVLIALIVAQAAYSADLIRAALDQVPRSQLIGLQGLGFDRKSLLVHLKIPF